MASSTFVNSAVQLTFAESPNSGNGKRWLVVAMVFVLYALGGHTLLHAIAPDGGIDEALAIRQGGDPLRLLGYGLLAAIALWSLRTDQPRGVRVHPRFGRCVLFTLFWMALSILWSDVTFLSVKNLVGALVLWLCCGAVGRTLGVNEFRIAGLIYAAGVTLLGVICELSLSAWHPLTAGYRFSGTTDPNAQGLICALLMISLLHWSPGAHWLRWIKGLTALAAVLLLLLTQSRGAILALSMSGTVIVATRWKRPLKVVLIGFVCMLCAGTLVFVASDYAGIGDFLQAATVERDTVAADGFGGARLALWKECFAALRARPLLGYGYGAFWGEDRMREIGDNIGWPVTNAHSGYLETALGTGGVGFAAFIVLLSSALTICIRDYRSTRCVEARYSAALVVLVLTNMIFESLTTTTYAANVLLICIILRIASSRKTHSGNDHAEISTVTDRLSEQCRNAIRRSSVAAGRQGSGMATSIIPEF